MRKLDLELLDGQAQRLDHDIALRDILCQCLYGL
jgi:hypothetical protein